jgi:hypothetical protein
MEDRSYRRNGTLHIYAISKQQKRHLAAFCYSFLF